MFLNKFELEVIKIYTFLSLYDYFFYVNRARALCMIFFSARSNYIRCILICGLSFVYSTTLNFGVLPLVEIDNVTRYCLPSAGACQCIEPVLGNFRSKFSIGQFRPSV